MINNELVADLDADILEMALNIFIKNASNEVKLLNQAHLNKDLDSVRKFAHKLKGSSISVGLEEFSNQSSKIEKLTVDGNIVPESVLLEFNQTFEKIVKYIC